jgi:predicted neuraminidase
VFERESTIALGAVAVHPSNPDLVWVGTGEGNPDVAIWRARRHAGQWQPPVELVREPNTPTWNPVFFHSGDGLLWLYYKFGTSPQQWTAGRMSSRDEGQSWSKAEHLPAGLYGPIRAKPLVLPKGLIVSGSSVESYNSWAAWVERSTDFGKTWSRFGPIMPPQGGIIQPTVIQVAGKHLRFYARSNQLGRICVSDSYDEGVTWSAARATDLPNPNSGIDVVHLKDARYVVVYNHTPRGRTPLRRSRARAATRPRSRRSSASTAPIRRWCGSSSTATPSRTRRPGSSTSTRPCSRCPGATTWSRSMSR